MTLPRFLRVAITSLFIVLGFACAVVGQTEIATVSGLVTDRTGATVSGAEVRLQSVERGTVTTAATNDAGIYVFPSVHPGQYQISIQKQGFKQVDLLGLVVNVQDHIEQNFRLEVGSVAESVTVEAAASIINTTDASVSTVVDRQFAENLPMNGRSFQTLIDLTPGVVVTPSNVADGGQFSVNGQRGVSNYWMVDGVSANVGVSTTSNAGNGLSGAAPSFSVLGGTNSLVSVDALQEFRIQTSTYAPEFGRTPGGQISIVTRSGVNEFHGTLFDYFRNDVLDANDWFANANKLPKPEERQNDFGGTFSGPIIKGRTFFFFSYEGLRLRLPQVVQSPVPDLSTRKNAIPAMQPYLNAFPLPSPGAPDNSATGIAQLNASYSNAATLDAYSMRIDHKLTGKLNLFGRYNYSPSKLIQRGAGGVYALSTVFPAKITTQTGTAGAAWTISPSIVNDLRFNYSRTSGESSSHFDNFGGAVPLSSLGFPSPFTSQNGALQLFAFSMFTGNNPNGLNVGPQGNNLQRQINLVDSVSVQVGSHSVKFGADFRRLSPVYGNPAYQQEALFFDVPSEAAGNPFVGFISSTQTATMSFRNLGAFAQDTWRVLPRLTLTYGLRWDVDFAPTSNPPFAAVTGFNLSNLSNLALAPAGTPPYSTTYGNIAPRVGFAYQISQSRVSQTVLRGGFGVFYDLASSEAGNLVAFFHYPFGTSKTLFGTAIGGTATFPFSSADAAPPAITAANVISGGIFGFDPNLKLPYTLQWNLALERGLGEKQTLTASYIGSTGRRLIQTFNAFSRSPNFATANLVTNAATSDYHALQLQFQRRLSQGLQALTFYTWSHSTDDASAGSIIGNNSNAFLPGVTNSNRGPSDFDIRNAFSAGLTYQIPAPKTRALTDVVLPYLDHNVFRLRPQVSANRAQVGKGSIQTRSRPHQRMRKGIRSGKEILAGTRCVLSAPPNGTLLSIGIFQFVNL